MGTFRHKLLRFLRVSDVFNCRFNDFSGFQESFRKSQGGLRGIFNLSGAVQDFKTFRTDYTCRTNDLYSKEFLKAFKQLLNLPFGNTCTSDQKFCFSFNRITNKIQFMVTKISTNYFSCFMKMTPNLWQIWGDSKLDEANSYIVY